MNKIDRERFFFAYQGPMGMLSPNAREGLDYLLGCLEADRHVTDIRHGAYMLATTKLETANTFRPIHEHGDRAYFIKRYGSQTRVGKELGNDTPEEGATYAGKGFTQTTGENNSEMLEKILPQEYPEVIARWEAKHGRKFDLTVGDQPGDDQDNMALLDPEIAYINMSVSMRKGLYTGVGLRKYINGEKCDYINARRIINGTDAAEKIAGYAVIIEAALRAAVIEAA